MAKFKPVRPKKKQVMPQGGIGCIVLVCAAIALILLFMFFVMKYASG